MAGPKMTRKAALRQTVTRTRSGATSGDKEGASISAVVNRERSSPIRQASVSRGAEEAQNGHREEEGA